MAGLKVGFISLGCPKNQVDCELMISRVRGLGLAVTRRMADADAIVVNTCSFIESAIDEADNEIRDALRYKARGRCRAVVVSGCLPQYLKEKCAEKYPQVDAWLTPDNPQDIDKVLEGLLAGAGKFEPPAGKHLPSFLATSADNRVLSTPPSLAYVKIAEGCSHGCRFCIIPRLRGRYRSRTIQDIRSEVAGLADQGIPEIVLISQDSTQYGCDLAGDGGPVDLAGLLSELAKVPGDFWLRVMYLYPDGITDTLLKTWSMLAPKVLPYFDLPLQHVNGDVLRSMGRNGDQSTIDALLDRIKAHCPDAVLRTSLITGYPGETEEQFNDLLAWVESGRIDHLGVFTYSELPEMASSSLTGKITALVKESRAQRIMEAQANVFRDKAAGLIGTQIGVVFEKKERERSGGWVMSGRSWREAYEIDGSVLVRCARPTELFVRRIVRITGIEGVDLLGVLIE